MGDTLQRCDTQTLSVRRIRRWPNLTRRNPNYLRSPLSQATSDMVESTSAALPTSRKQETTIAVIETRQPGAH